MSLINTDLLRGLGSGRGTQSSCLAPCTGLGSRTRDGAVGFPAEGGNPRTSPALTWWQGSLGCQQKRGKLVIL